METHETYYRHTYMYEKTNQDKTHKKIKKKREDKKTKIKRLLIVKQRLKTRNDKQIFLINVFEHV